jgi:hypothetical protein
MLEYLHQFRFKTSVIAENLETLTCFANSDIIIHIDGDGRKRKVTLPAPVVAVRYLGSYDDGSDYEGDDYELYFCCYWYALCSNGLEYGINSYQQSAYLMWLRPNLAAYLLT